MSVPKIVTQGDEWEKPEGRSDAACGSVPDFAS